MQNHHNGVKVFTKWNFFKFIFYEIFSRLLVVQVNLCQKLLFLHRLTHNMTTDCSLFMKILSSEYLQNMLFTKIVVFVLTLRTILVQNMFCRCYELLKKIYLYFNSFKNKFLRVCLNVVIWSFENLKFKTKFSFVFLKPNTFPF